MLVFTIVQVAVLAQLAYAAWLAPLSTGPGSDARHLRRVYRSWVAAAGLACVGTSAVATILARASAPQYATASTAAYALLFLALVGLYARARVAADRLRRPVDPPPSRMAFPTCCASGVAVPALIAAGFAAARPAHLPSTIAVHWTAAGVADRFAPTDLDVLTRFVGLQIMSAVVIIVAGANAWQHGEHRGTPAAFRVFSTAAGVQLDLLVCSLILCEVLPPSGLELAAALTPLGVAVGGVAVDIARGHRRDRRLAAKTA